MTVTEVPRADDDTLYQMMTNWTHRGLFKLRDIKQKPRSDLASAASSVDAAISSYD
jgi:hypothetical protein